MNSVFTIADFARLDIDTCEPHEDRWVKPDGWNVGGCLESSDWDAAQFRLPTGSNGPIKSLAVNITVTGKKVRYYYGMEAVRVRIEFVGDGEPSTFTNGWMGVRAA